MASITLTISDAQLARVVAALCDTAGLPRSNANARTALVNLVKQTVRNAERAAALRAAQLEAAPVFTDPGVS